MSMRRQTTNCPAYVITEAGTSRNKMKPENVSQSKQRVKYADPVKKVNMVLNVHRNHKAY